MEKLELKHLACYLPYGLKVQYLANEIVELVGFNRNTIFHTTGFFVELPCNLKPILRPLSDLTKEEYRCLFYGNVLDYKIDELPYKVVDKLFSWHFDVFGLINKGLAIDINTL